MRYSTMPGKRAPYKTKKRRHEFKLAYSQISDMNNDILDYEVEIQTHLKYGHYDEAIHKQHLINDMKIRLLEMAKDGWDIEYVKDRSSGLEVIEKPAELD